MTTETINDFGFTVLKKLLDERESGENVAFCPPSLYLTLAVLAMGSRDSTLSELTKILGSDFSKMLVLEQSDIACDPLGKVLKTLIEKLSEITKYRCKIFNRCGLLETYAKQASSLFLVEHEKVDYSDEKDVIELINQWTSTATDGQIQKILEEVEQNINFIVINTLLFKGMWKKAFKDSKTTQKPFYIDDLQTCTVDMMSTKKTLQIGYDHATKATVLFMPFKDAKTEAIFVLPGLNVPIGETMRKITSKVIKTWKALSSYQKVQASIPKLMLAGRLNLKRTLFDMGVSNLFTPFCANLSNMTPSQSSVADIYQVVAVNIDETGVTAAAATCVQIQADGCIAEEIISFELSRPFLFIVGDVETGLVLFSTVVRNPNN